MTGNKTPKINSPVLYCVRTVHVQHGSVKSFRSAFVQQLCNDVYCSILVPFPFLLYSVFSFMRLARAPFIARWECKAAFSCRTTVVFSKYTKQRILFLFKQRKNSVTISRLFLKEEIAVSWQTILKFLRGYKESSTIAWKPWEWLFQRSEWRIEADTWEGRVTTRPQ